MSANIRIPFGLQIVLVCLYSTPSHYHHCANLSEGIEHINTCQIYFVECVSKIKHILSVIHYTICGAVCFQFTHFSCDDWRNIYTLSYYHHQIGSMNYYPLFRVRSWNNGVRCMSFYTLIKFISRTSFCGIINRSNKFFHIHFQIGGFGASPSSATLWFGYTVCPFVLAIALSIDCRTWYQSMSHSFYMGCLLWTTLL